MPQLRLPRDTERHAIVGTTGSGKTVFGAWCLAHRDFDRKPWIIIDFKREKLFAQLPQCEEIDIDDRIPKQKGLYIVRPDPLDVDEGRVTAFLRRIWKRENTGVFIDEGYEIKRLDPGLRALLTQGRSKHIPVISLSQRPAYISPWLLSESEFKSVFYLEHPADVERMNEYMPAHDASTLPDHWSYWYQRDGRVFRLMEPCPPENEILDVFDNRRVRRGLLWGAI